MGNMIKVYRSKARPGLRDADIDALLQSSRRNNRAVGIGGMLLFGRGCFVQLIEGAGPAVERTYRRILSDPRHIDAMLLYDGSGEPRRFPGWSMGFARLECFIHLPCVESFLQHVEEADAEGFGADAALAMLLEFRRAQAQLEAALAS